MALPFCTHIHHTARLRPTDTAVIEGELCISYGDLSESVNSLELSLQELGIGPGDRVALVATKTINSVTTILGTLQAGAVVVPINPLLKSEQIVHILNDCDAKLFLCSQTCFSELVAERVKLPVLNNVVFTSDEFSPVSVRSSNSATTLTCGFTSLLEWSEFTSHTLSGRSESLTIDTTIEPTGDVAAILYTSGSTGIPKGVALTQTNLHYGALSVSTYLENTAQDRILGLMPLSFDYGLSQLTTTVLKGACLVLHDYLFPKSVIDIIQEHRITGLPAVPHLWDQLMAISWPDLVHLRYATSTGGRLQEPTIESIATRLPHTRLYSMYGFTEAFRATYLPPSELNARPKSIGKAVPFATVLVVDAEGNELPPGKIGELIQSGPLVASGYWNDPKESQHKFRARSVKAIADNNAVYAWSGDLCYADEEGFLYFVSRRDEQVKLNGHRVSPADIERTLAQCEWVQEVCVLCVPHTRFGHVAIAFVVTPNKVTDTELTQWCRTRMPNYMVPDEWYFVPRLPSSPNNKIDRNALLQHHMEGSHE